MNMEQNITELGFILENISQVQESKNSCYIIHDVQDR